MDDLAALTHGSPCSAVNGVPEALYCRMPRAPLIPEQQSLSVGKAIRLEFPPGVQTTHIAKRQIGNFANSTFFLGDILRRVVDDFASCNAIRLIRRIVSCVEAPVCLKLPGFTGRRAIEDRAETLVCRTKPLRN